jgi:hypothetical protein
MAGVARSRGGGRPACRRGRIPRSRGGAVGREHTLPTRTAARPPHPRAAGRR